MVVSRAGGGLARTHGVSSSILREYAAETHHFPALATFHGEIDSAMFATIIMVGTAVGDDMIYTIHGNTTQNGSLIISTS